MLQADPDTAEPAAKMVRAPSIVGRRPKICASFPLNGRHAADARLYADATHEKSCPSRSLTIVGAAVATAPCRTASACAAQGPRPDSACQCGGTHQVERREQQRDAQRDVDEPEPRAAPRLVVSGGRGLVGRRGGRSGWGPGGRV